MKILLLGADGQLGWQLRRSLCVLGDVTALTRLSTHACGDLTDADGIARTIRGLRPDVIVNAAAYTAVDRAEAEPEAAFAVNERACATLAEEAAKANAWLISYSTEYVFEGGGQRPWEETDSTAPLNVYGRSKLAGEEVIARTCKKHLILRASWLFDTWGSNFLKSILKAALERPAIDVVGDQWGAPTRAALVADATSHLVRRLQPQLAGIYHIAAAGEASRHDYAVFALECALKWGVQLKAGPNDVRRISTPEASTPARRPANSRMNTARICRTFDVVLPPWQQGVDAVVAELARARQPTPPRP